MTTKLVLMGTPASSMPTLGGLIKSDYEIQAVVTRPDRLVGRKRTITPIPVKEATLKHSIRVPQPKKTSDLSEMEEIIKLVSDVIVIVAFSQFLPEKLLQISKLGATNVHASLPPKYRGGVSAHYAIMNGEKETGITIMEMIRKMDVGGIYAQESIPITKQDDAGMMFEKLSLLGRKLLLETLPNILDGQKPVSQDESEAAFSPNITWEQEAIDRYKTVEETDNQVCGMCPWPIAFMIYEGIRWKSLSVEVLAETADKAPGMIIWKDKKNLWIVCGKRTVSAANRLQPTGKGKQTVHDFLNGSGQQVQIGRQVKQ